jgi:SAM-dependent methyltransferase
MSKLELQPQYYFFYNVVTSVISHAFHDRQEVTILEPGCGTGYFCNKLIELLNDDFPTIKFKVCGFDVTQRPQHQQIDSKVVTLISENDNWPYPDGAIDLIISNQVLEHVKNIDFFFSEQNRVMSKGSYVIHSFPVKEIIVEPHYKLPFVHWVGNWEYRKYLIKILSQLGLGTYGYQKNNGFTEGLEKWSILHSDYTTNFTHYLELNDYLNIAKSNGLRASLRFTNSYFLYRFLEKLGVNYLDTRLENEFSLLTDYFLVHIYKRLASIFLCLHNMNEM